MCGPPRFRPLTQSAHCQVGNGVSPPLGSQPDDMGREWGSGRGSALCGPSLSPETPWARGAHLSARSGAWDQSTGRLAVLRICPPNPGGASPGPGPGPAVNRRARACPHSSAPSQPGPQLPPLTGLPPPSVPKATVPLPHASWLLWMAVAQDRQAIPGTCDRTSWHGQR